MVCIWRDVIETSYYRETKRAWYAAEAYQKGTLRIAKVLVAVDLVTAAVIYVLFQQSTSSKDGYSFDPDFQVSVQPNYHEFDYITW